MGNRDLNDMVIFDSVRGLPPCATCGSQVVKKKNLKIDWHGKWKGNWRCENDHRNILK